MALESLAGLAVHHTGVNHETSETVSYDEVIDDSAA